LVQALAYGCAESTRYRHYPGKEIQMTNTRMPRTQIANHCNRNQALPRRQSAKPSIASRETTSTPVKGAISLLQEFVQSSTKLHLPSNHSVLQWKFDTRMADEATLQFRATVAFLLEGVPHHAAGSWHPSKKMAQRDAAERSLQLFVHRWGEEQRKDRKEPAPVSWEVGLAEEVQLLYSYSRTCDIVSGDWLPKIETCRLDDGSDFWQAHIELQIMGVPHRFKAAPMESEEAATIDVAKRVLWYLKCPGFDDVFELDPNDPALLSLKIPPPAENWAAPGAPAADAAEVAEKKTAVMRVQNRLQQTFSRRLRPGQSVWEWSYETDPKDEDWPPLYRATVQILVVSKSFTGEWLRGQREAQISAITDVMQFLDTYDESDTTLCGSL